MVRTEKGNFSENSDSGVVDDAATCLFLWWELVLTPEEEAEKRRHQILAEKNRMLQNGKHIFYYMLQKIRFDSVQIRRGFI